MRAVLTVVRRYLQMANNLEGGGRTPLLAPGRLQELGFSIVAYPLSLIGTATAAMSAALDGLRRGEVPPPGALPPFKVRSRNPPETQGVPGASRWKPVNVLPAAENCQSPVSKFPTAHVMDWSH